MSKQLHITDDGDEVVFFKIGDELIGSVDHGLYGWAGMEEAIKLVTHMAEVFGVEVVNTQDIV